MEYRIATSNEVAYVVGLCKELHALGSYRHIPVDDAYLYRFVLNAILHDDYYVQVAIDDDGIFVGFVAGMVVPMVFTPRRIGVEHAWYVREGTKNRGKTAARLMRNFVDWCVMEKSVIHVQAGDVANINSTAVDGLYRVLGFKRAGTIYMYKEA